ncbi:MAG: hypothetical protein ABW277_09465 [Longimicrobiaceae bacterium]
MLALFCPDRRLSERLRAALPAGEQVLAAWDWRGFERAAPAAECSVVAAERLADEPARSRLAAFKLRHPLHPVVLVTRRDADNVRHLTWLRVEEVVWPDEVDARLGTAVTRARTSGLLHRLAAAFEGSPDLAVPLRTALACSCRVVPPVHSVARLAQMAGCDRRTLWRYWRMASHGSRALRLEDILHWLLLLRGVSSKVPGHGWTTVASELGVHEHTLGRLAHHLTGRTLRELAAGGPPAILSLFLHEVLDPLLGEHAWDDTNPAAPGRRSGG